jgi:hypothetical protein
MSDRFPYALVDTDDPGYQQRPNLREEVALVALVKRAAAVASAVLRRHDPDRGWTCPCVICQHCRALAFNLQTGCSIESYLIHTTEPEDNPLPTAAAAVPAVSRTHAALAALRRGTLALRRLLRVLRGEPADLAQNIRADVAAVVNIMTTYGQVIDSAVPPLTTKNYPAYLERQRRLDAEESGERQADAPALVVASGSPGEGRP